MAKLDRRGTLEKLFARGDWALKGSPIPEWIDSDFAIDTFGKLAKGGITQEMLDFVCDVDEFAKKFDIRDGHNVFREDTIENPSPLAWASALDVKLIKRIAKENGFEVAETPKPFKKKKEVSEVKEVTPIVERVEVKPIEIDTNAVIGAIGKSMGEAFMVDYGQRIAETAFPWIKEYIKETYGISEKKVKFVVPEHGEIEGIFHECFEEVLQYVLGGAPVMLVGEAGTGKNVICEQIAEALGQPFYFANKVSDEYQLKGYMDAKGEFQSTPLYKAMKEGGVFMLDEMDASSEEALEVLHSVLANKYLTFPNGEFVRSHENFRVVAGCNTFGTGATYQYVGRRQLDGATLNRFMTVVVDYSPTIENALSDDTELINFYRKFRNCCKEFGINHIVSYRNLIQMDRFVDAVGVEKVLKSALLKNLEKDDLTMLTGRFSGDNDRWAKGLMSLMA